MIIQNEDSNFDEDFTGKQKYLTVKKSLKQKLRPRNKDLEKMLQKHSRKNTRRQLIE